LIVVRNSGITQGNMSAENHEGEHQEQGMSPIAFIFAALDPNFGGAPAHHDVHHDAPHETSGHDDHGGGDAEHAPEHH
jgi:hypothetical protein